MTIKINPSFFIIGTQKGGTSTLHGWLKQHSEICLPNLKETHYYSFDEYYKKGIGWYHKWFRPTDETKLFGEVDPSYMYFPQSVERIKKHHANPKFIFILRRPIERAYSHFQMSCQRGHENESFFEALEEEDKRLDNDQKIYSLLNHSYLTRGNYCKQIKHSFQKTKKGIKL